MKNTLVISLVVLAVIAGLVYMSMNKKASEEEMAGGAKQEAMVKENNAVTTETSIESGSMEDKVIVVEASNFKFNIDTIIVKKGEKMKLVFKNLEGMHDFRVDELGIKTKIFRDKGEEVVEFTADKVGTFEFYCSVEEHRQMGMVGTLVVEE